MPKFIGATIPGAQERSDMDLTKNHVRLIYMQAARLEPSDVVCVLDTSDYGRKGVYAKRWYRWYALAKDIIASKSSTKNMILLAASNMGAHVVDRCGITHATHGDVHATGALTVTMKQVDCMTCLIMEARGE